MTDYKTFGEMSKEEQLALFVAWQEGKEIQCLIGETWLTVQWGGDVFFRVTFSLPHRCS